MDALGGDPAGMVEVGSPAPEIELRDHHGQRQRLSDRRGTRNVLVVFYPFAFTGVCSGELQALSDRAEVWAQLGTDVLAVSCDSVPALSAFAAAQGYAITLLSDHWPHGAVATAYGVFDPVLGAASRGSFVIDREGVVRATVRTAIPQAREVDDYVAALDGLQELHRS